MKIANSLTIVATIAITSLTIVAAASRAETMAVKSDGTAQQRLTGKALASSLHCTGCHSADLSGHPNFAPSLRASGVTKEYNQKAFERVMSTGITNDGKPVSPPMKAYGLKASQADDIYFYLLSLK